MININRNRMEGGNIDSIGLKIQKVLRTDLGNYSCELQNDYGIGSSENAITLDIHCKYSRRFVARNICIRTVIYWIKYVECWIVQ